MKSGYLISLAVVVMAVASLFSIVGLLRIDQIVHRDLYSYGLQFSYDWATPYWSIKDFVFAMNGLSIIAALVLPLYTLVIRRRELKQLVTVVEGGKVRGLEPTGTAKRHAMRASGSGLASWVVLFMAAASLFSILGMYRIDQIIHHDLYSYGLQFSYEWATAYWNTARTLLAIGGLGITAAIAAHLYVLVSKRRQITFSTLGSYRKWLFGSLLIVILSFAYLYSIGSLAMGGTSQNAPPPAGFWGLYIEASPTSGGILIPSGRQNIAVGSGITVKAMPTRNYILDSWQFDGLYLGAGISNPILVDAQTEGTVHTLTAVFKIPSSPQQINLASNPSFEFGREYWNGWIWDPNAVLVGTTAYYSNDAYDGAHCVGGNITQADPTGRGRVIWSQDVPRWDLRPGKAGTYSVRAAVKGNQPVGVTIQYFSIVNGSEKRIGSDLFHISDVSSTTWQISDWITFTTPNDPNYNHFSVLFYINLVGWFELDQVELIGPS